MPALASNVLLRTNHSSRDSVFLLVTTWLTHKSARSARYCSSNGQMATRTRQAWSASQHYTRNCRNLHVQWLRDRKFCKTPTIPMERMPPRQRITDPVPPRVLTRRVPHIAQLRSPQQLQLLQALHLSSPRADTRTRTTPPSTCPRKEIT